MFTSPLINFDLLSCLCPMEQGFVALHEFRNNSYTIESLRNVPSAQIFHFSYKAPMARCNTKPSFHTYNLFYIIYVGKNLDVSNSDNWAE